MVHGRGGDGVYFNISYQHKFVCIPGKVLRWRGGGGAFIRMNTVFVIRYMLGLSGFFSKTDWHPWFRDWSLITGKGRSYKTGRGRGPVKFDPYGRKKF